MEITARPRSGRRRRLAGRVTLLSVALLLAVLVPASFGLTQHAVADDAMGGRLARGALAFDRPIHSVNQLRPGDVITFAAPAGDGDLVTRRVVAVDDGMVTTRGDRRHADDPWLLDAATVRPSLTVLVVPFAGYPELLVPGLTWAVLALAAVVVALACLLLARREAVRGRASARPVTLQWEGQV